MKINNKKIIAGLLTFTMAAGMAVIPNADNVQAAAKVKINKKTVTVNQGKKAVLKVKNAGKQKVKAKIASKKIAAVKVTKKKVTVTGKTAGKTKLTISVKGLKKVTVPVTVKKKANKKAKQVKKTQTPTPTPDMQPIAKAADINAWLTADEANRVSNLSVTGKKLGDKILLCVTNNNDVAVNATVYGEYYRSPSADSPGGYDADTMISARYIAPHSKYYGIIYSYHNKKAWNCAISDLKIGGISCDLADEKYNTNGFKTDFYAGKYGIPTAKITMPENKKKLDYLYVIYVFKDGAGNVLDAYSGGKSVDSDQNNTEVEIGLYDIPSQYASVESCYSYESSDDWR